MKYKIYFEGHPCVYCLTSLDADGNLVEETRVLITEEEAVLLKLQYSGVTVENIEDEI